MTVVEEIDVNEEEQWDYLGYSYCDILLRDPKIPGAFRNNDCDVTVTDFLQDLYDDCLEFEEDEDEEVFDHDSYIERLEASVVALNRQHALLLACLVAPLVSTGGNVELTKLDLLTYNQQHIRKMISYAFTGKEPVSPNSRGLYNEKDYYECIQAHDSLPPELQPRAAEWIAHHASKLYQTEHEIKTPLDTF